MASLLENTRKIRKLKYTSDYNMALDVGISSYPLWKFLKGQRVSKDTEHKIERFVIMWIHNNKKWFDESDIQSLRDEKQEILEMYKTAINQYNKLLEQNKQLQAELIQAKSLLAISETTNKIITAVQNKEDVLR